MLEDNRKEAGCVRNEPSARVTIVPARLWNLCGILAFCVLAFALPVLAQDGSAPVTAPLDKAGERIKENWLWFSVLGGLMVVSFGAFVYYSRKKDPVTPPQVGLAGAVSSQGESPWARSSASVQNPTPPLSYANGAGNNPATGDPSAMLPTVSPDVNAQQAAAAQYAALHTPQPPAPSPVAVNPVYHQADPMMPANAQAVAEMPATNTPIVPLGYPLTTPANRAQVDFLVASDADAPQAQTVAAPTQSSPSAGDQTIYMTADGERTIDEGNPTLTVLPGYFEIVASGDPVKDPIGTRKKLYALNSNPDFGIARPTNDQEQIANFIPLHSKRVSRSTDKQGKVVYDFQKGIYTVINFADPTHTDPDRRCNPIRVEGRPLMPNEGVTIRDGDRIQVGDIMLRFHIEGRAATVNMPKSSSKKARNVSRNPV